jgi:predicted nuclease with TOPRIM domain
LNRDKKNFEARENSIKVEIKRLEAKNNGLNEKLKKMQEKGENIEFKNSFVVMGNFHPKERDIIMNVDIEASYVSKVER